MTIQEAAKLILEEEKTPLSSRGIAKRALDRGLVTSRAKDPILSHAATIEKNIRNEVYNKPELIFIKTSNGRLIGLPTWSSQEQVVSPKSATYRMVSLNIPIDLYDQIELAAQSKIAESFETTIILLLKKGISEYVSEIREKLLSKIDRLSDVK